MTCGLQCAPGTCARRYGVDLEAEAIVRLHATCARRGVLPRAGGLEDQDAATVLWFDVLDGMRGERAMAAEVTE